MAGIFDAFVSMIPQLASGAASAFQGYQNSNQGIDLQLEGARISSDAYKRQGIAEIAAAKYNAQLDQYKTSRILESVNTQFRNLIGENKTRIAASGLSATSKSAMMVTNEALNLALREIDKIKNDAHQRQEAIMFSGANRAVSAFDRARAATYSGQVAAFQSKLEQSKQTSGMITNLASGVSSGLMDAFSSKGDS